MHKLAREDGWAPLCALCCLSHIGPSSIWHVYTMNGFGSGEHMSILTLKFG